MLKIRMEMPKNIYVLLKINKIRNENLIYDFEFWGLVILENLYPLRARTRWPLPVNDFGLVFTSVLAPSPRLRGGMIVSACVSERAR